MEIRFSALGLQDKCKVTKVMVFSSQSFFLECEF